MPYRLQHPLAFVVAMFGVFTSFLGTASQWVAGQAHLFTGRPLFGAVNDSTLISLAGSAVAVLAVASPGLFKFLKEWSAARVARETAEADTWSGKLSKEVVSRAEVEGRLKFANETIEELKVKVATVEAQLAQELSKQGAEIAENRHSVQNLQQESVMLKDVAKRVANAATEQTAKVDEHSQRIEHLERSTGSSDSIPATG